MLLLLPFVLLAYASIEVTKNVVLLPQSAPEAYEQTIKYVLRSMYLVKKVSECLFLEKPYITLLVVTSKIKPSRVLRLKLDRCFFRFRSRSIDLLAVSNVSNTRFSFQTVTVSMKSFMQPPTHMASSPLVRALK